MFEVWFEWILQIPSAAGTGVNQIGYVRVDVSMECDSIHSISLVHWSSIASPNRTVPWLFGLSNQVH